MELVLTGRQFDADEAERWGVASRIVRTEKKEGDEHLPVVEEALDVASKIASHGRISTQAAKEAVNAGQYHQQFNFARRPTESFWVVQPSIYPSQKAFVWSVASSIVFSQPPTKKKV